MAQPGSSVFRQVQSLLDETRESARAAKHETDMLDVQMNELVTRKGSALMELARHYLPEISRHSIESTFEGIRSSLLEVLGRKERTQAELTSRHQRFLGLIQRMEAELAEVTARLNEKVHERESLETKVAEQLKLDAEFPQLAEEAAHAEARLQQNEARVKEIQQSAAEKLPSYRDSSLFQYLLRVKYGTADYKARGWTRRWDKWVADLIGFPRAKQGYDFLQTTPELMAKEMARRQTEFKLLMQKIEAIENRYADSSGLTAVCEAGQKLGARRDEIVASLETARSEHIKVEQELQELDQKQGRFYEEAIKKFELFLGQTETSVLETRAKRTADPRDDEIVGRIAILNEQIEGLKPRIAQELLNRKQADEVAQGAELVVSRFRQNNFDSDRSSFSPLLDVNAELQRFRKGLLKPEELWQTIRREQRFEPTQSEILATQAAHTLAGVLADPHVSRVLIGAVANVAGSALNALAQQGVERRAPVRHQEQIKSGRPPAGGRFTTGEGF